MISSATDSFFKKPYLYLLAAAIFLVKLPPFYIVPTIEASNSNNLIRVCILLALVTAALARREQAKKVFGALNIMNIAVGFYFVSQSISVLDAVNLPAFFNVYKDLIVSLVLFYSLLLLNREEVIFLVKVFVVSTVFNIVYQFAYIFIPAFQDVTRYFINSTYQQFVDYQTKRGRYFGDTLDETLIPLFFLYFTVAKKPFKKMAAVGVVVLMVFLVVLSSWRTKFIILIFELIGSFALFKPLRKHFLTLLPILLAVFLFSNTASISLVGQNIYDRLLSGDNQTEILIEKSRFNYLRDATEIGFTYPLTGAGLGNYYDNLSQISKRSNQTTVGSATDRSFILIDDPHNMLFSAFASSGIIGLVSLVALLAYFFISDLRLFSKGLFEKTVVLSFWGYCIFSMLNPWMYFAFLVPFWFIRGIIENFKLKIWHSA